MATQPRLDLLHLDFPTPQPDPVDDDDGGEVHDAAGAHDGVDVVEDDPDGEGEPREDGDVERKVEEDPLAAAQARVADLEQQLGEQSALSVQEIQHLADKIAALESDVASWKTGHDTQAEHRAAAEARLAALHNSPIWEIHWASLRVWVAAKTIEIAIVKAKALHPDAGEPSQVRQGGVKIIF